MEFGATEFFNPTEHDRPAQQVLVEMTDGGLDFTFECIGNVKTMVKYISITIKYHICGKKFSELH